MVEYEVTNVSSDCIVALSELDYCDEEDDRRQSKVVEPNPFMVAGEYRA